MKPDRLHMKAHIEGLLVAFDTDRRFVRLTRQAKCVWACREVSIPEIKSPVSYASALHEIGHILARHGESRRCLVRERAAWQWAKAHALIWTESRKGAAFRASHGMARRAEAACRVMALSTGAAPWKTGRTPLEPGRPFAGLVADTARRADQAPRSRRGDACGDLAAATK